MCIDEEDVDIKMIALTIVAKYGKDALDVVKELERITLAPEHTRAVAEEVVRLMKTTRH